MFTSTSTVPGLPAIPAAVPWYIVPANRKWFRDLAVGEILLDVLEGLHPAYPSRDDLPPDVVVT